MFPKITRVHETEPFVQLQQSKPEQCKKRKCIYQNLETGQLYTNILMPYLDNASEEAISERRVNFLLVTSHFH